MLIIDIVTFRGPNQSLYGFPLISLDFSELF